MNVPTTEQVRAAYLDRRDFEAQVRSVERPTDAESGAEFDAWLAETIRETFTNPYKEVQR